MTTCRHCGRKINPAAALCRFAGDDLLSYCGTGCLTRAVAEVIGRFDMLRTIEKLRSET